MREEATQRGYHLRVALHHSLRSVATRTRAVYGVAFLANSGAIGCTKRLVSHPDPHHHILAGVMQGIPGVALPSRDNDKEETFLWQVTQR